MTYAKVNNGEHLQKLVAAGQTDYFISLNFGLRSYKYITQGETKDFEVTNCIDDTTEELSVEELDDENLTNIGKAIQRGAFWYCSE